MKPIIIAILTAVTLTGCTIRQICTAPVTTYNSAGTKCVEYTKKCICIGNGKFIRPDGNIYKLNDDNNKYKVGKKYLVYFNNVGTDDISDDIIVAVK